MAMTDSDLIGEVRSITNYSTAQLSDGDIQELIDIAKREIKIETGLEIEDFYADRIREDTLFWAVCFFAKIKSGEYDGLNIAISEIEITESSKEDSGELWARKFHARLKQLGVEERTYIGNVSRTGRNYSNSRNQMTDL